MGMNQPPQGANTDPTLLKMLAQSEQQSGVPANGDPNQPQQMPQGGMGPMGGPEQMGEQPEQQPEQIVTYDDAIDGVLKLIVTLASSQELAKDVQAKSILELSQSAKYLQDAATPQTDPQAQMDLQNQQQLHQQSIDQANLDMQKQLHEQQLAHNQQLHEQTLKHNDTNQALKEWQAQEQMKQNMLKQGQDMVHKQNTHDMNMENMMNQANNLEPNKSNDTTTK